MSVFIPISRKGNAKDCSDYCTIAAIPHENKVVLKICPARLQQYVNQELPDVQARFRKGRGTIDQIANIHWIIEKAREFQKNICFDDYAKAFDCVNQQTVDKRDGNNRSLYLPPEKPVCRSRSNRTGHGTTDWFQIGKVCQIGFQTGKKYIEAVYYHFDYLTYMQSTSCEMPD